MSSNLRLTLLAALSLASAAALGCAPHRDWAMSARDFVVAADHADASRAGAEILAKGGNAVDAAVATSFALAVVRPESCGLGGGGFMLIHRPGAAPIALDYREQAPAAISLDHYRNAGGEFDTGKIQRGGLSVGIPGTVRGLLHALDRYGSGRVSRAEVIAPAIRLARRPLRADTHLRESIDAVVKYLAEHHDAKLRFPTLRSMLLDERGAPRAAIERSDLATTLASIAARGATAFYEGDIAGRIVDTVQADGGILTREDLHDYAVREWPPLKQNWRGHTIFAMPPPSSGGAVIIETLNILDARLGDGLAAALAADRAEHAPRGDEQDYGDYSHVLIESLKLAFADRARWLGDAGPAVAADVARMTSGARAAALARRINLERAIPARELGARVLPADGGTSHISVIDADGAAVACTESINLRFGSYLVVPGTGIILNDTMDDFALDATTPNAFGLRQSERNLVRPGARPLSSMSPTIVTTGDGVRLVAGAAGGSRIISSTLQVILNTIVGGQSVDDAVAAPRVHHQWLPDVVQHQAQLSRSMRHALRRRGHTLEEFRPIGHVQAAGRTAGGELRAACDFDKGGRPAGK